MSLTAGASQPEIQELRVSADFTREVQSIVIKAFADESSASPLASEVAEVQRVTVNVSVIIQAGIDAC